MGEDFGAVSPDAAMAAGTMMLSLIVGVVFYAYFALCIFKIAKKINCEPAWLAWIPLAQWVFFLMMGGFAVWVGILLVVLSFVPMANIVASVALLVVSIIAWVRILKKMNRDPWKVLLLIIPVVNIVYMGILAFSKE